MVKSGGGGSTCTAMTATALTLLARTIISYSCAAAACTGVPLSRQPLPSAIAAMASPSGSSAVQAVTGSTVALFRSTVNGSPCIRISVAGTDKAGRPVTISKAKVEMLERVEFCASSGYRDQLTLPSGTPCRRQLRLSSVRVKVNPGGKMSRELQRPSLRSPPTLTKMISTPTPGINVLGSCRVSCGGATSTSSVKVAVLWPPSLMAVMM